MVQSQVTIQEICESFESVLFVLGEVALERKETEMGETKLVEMEIPRKGGVC